MQQGTSHTLRVPQGTLYPQKASQGLPEYDLAAGGCLHPVRRILSLVSAGFTLYPAS